MDGDEYVPQISQMNYNLINDMPTGNTSFYDQQQQQASSIGSASMYGSSGSLQGTTSSLSNIPQQKYASYHCQQQLIQGGSQSNILSPVSQQQQRFFMQKQHQMQPNIMPQHSMQTPMFPPIINAPSVTDMNSMPNVPINKIVSHPTQNTSQSSSSSTNSPLKTKNVRKSKKANATTVETAATSNSNNNTNDPRDFSVHTQQALSASYQPGFHPNNFQQHPIAIQQQRLYGGGNMYLQQQQQQQPWHANSAITSASFPTVVGSHHSQISAQQSFQQSQGISVSSAANNTFSSLYHNSTLPNQQQQMINNYYSQLKNTPTYFDQQSNYEMHYDNTTSGTQPQGRLPQTPYFDPSSTILPTSNTPAINSINPYYSQQQQQQQFSQNYGPLQQQIGINTKLNMQQQQYSIPSQHLTSMQHSPQVKTSTSIESTVLNSPTSTHVQTFNQMLPLATEASTSSTHWQSQQLNQTNQPLNVSPYYAQPQLVLPQQQVGGHHSLTHHGYSHQGYPHQQVSMISLQQQHQQIQFEQHQLQQEIFECERQIALCYQQQQRTAEINQRIEQFQQRIQFLRSRFVQLQQQQAFIANSSEQHKNMISQLPQSVLQQQSINMQPGLSITPKYSSSSATPAPLTSPNVLKKFNTNNNNNNNNVNTTVSSRGTTPAPSVSVFPAGTNQVQVSITPESTGKTVISVYHQKYFAAPPLPEQSNTGGLPISHSSNNSNEYLVPPEPVPPKKQRINNTQEEFFINQNLISNKLCSSQTKLLNKKTELNELHKSPPPAPENANNNQTIAITSELSAQNSYNIKTNTYRLNSVTSTSIDIPSTFQSSLTTVASLIPKTKLSSSNDISKESNKCDKLIQNISILSDKKQNEIFNENNSINEKTNNVIIDKLNNDKTNENIIENTELDESCNLLKSNEFKKIENFNENNVLKSLPNNVIENCITDNIINEKTVDLKNTSEIIIKKDNINFTSNIETSINNLTTETNTYQYIKKQNNNESANVLENAIELDNESCTKDNNLNSNNSSYNNYVINENDENVESIFNNKEDLIINKQNDFCKNIKSQQQNSIKKNTFDNENDIDIDFNAEEIIKKNASVTDDEDFSLTTKKKNYKQKKQMTKVIPIKNYLVDSTKKDEIKKKKSTIIKPIISKKRKRLDNLNKWSGDDQEDTDFIVSSKKRKFSTFSKGVVSNDFEDEILDKFIEKRRSGRKKVEKKYRDRDLDAELDLELENNIDSSTNNLGDTNNNDSVLQTNQNEWIVEKILGMRLVNRTIKNNNETEYKQTIEEDELIKKQNDLVLINYNDETLNSEKIENNLFIEVKNCINEIINNLIKNESKLQDDQSIIKYNKKLENNNDEVLNDTEKMEKHEQFFIKYKNRSYMHCDWKFADELELLDKRALCKINRYKQKFSCETINDEEYFNDDYIIVDRVLNDYFDENENEGYAFIKWRSLCYSECTWESIKNVPKSKIDESRKRNNEIDLFKLKERPRPSINKWEKITIDKQFKDGNTLREYQVEGVNWLIFCYLNQQNCILADEMGLGKTVQTITFLQGLYDLGIHGPFLIVVPLSTLHNWEREFETWTDMNAVVYHGSAASREIIQNYELYYFNDAKFDSKKKPIVKFDALITTFEMVVSDCEILRKINYRVCVIDEAHRLKNRNCKLLTGGLLSFKMEHRVLLTGTPLQNNIQELFSLLNFLEPEQFSNSESFLEQFGQCQTEEQVQKFQQILKPMMLRRLKEDVEKTLQPKEETIIEVQLSNIQKKYYRAILERNFTHLLKGSSVPSLMNTMMELRKCCNHPFLINGAEEQILSEIKLMNPFKFDDEIQLMGLIQSSGKMVLIDKLLPKLRQDGHKVLIFSQMVRVLDILEEFLINLNYPFERIDGNVRGDLRQAAIDRFSKQDSERFVFLLCTRAGGLGINLTAADTVIIFDSDWNPQNDLQAQARCHRIGQKKMVKVYRLITSNTYEREMFDKASLKLGLDKAVLQSMTPKENSQQLSRKEVEDLLRKGAYGAVMNEDNEGSKFSEEDIETILQRRTQTIRLEPGVKGSTFAKASFTSSSNREDIDINDPNFWSKWAKKANIDVDSVLNKNNCKSDVNESLIVLEPRLRRKRFEENYKTTESAEEDTASASIDDDLENNGSNLTTEKNKVLADSTLTSSKVSRSAKKRRRAGLTLASETGDEDYINSGYTPNELAFNKSEFFKVEKLLGIWGWGRWSLIKQKTDMSLSENDMEHISRTLLLHCIREFRGDDKTRDFVWNLIIPRGGIVEKTSLDNSNLSGGIYHQGWAALPEYNPPAFAVDSSFQRHVHRHANKLLARIHHLQILQKNIIGYQCNDIIEDKIDHTNVKIQISTVGDPPFAEWDSDCDKSFLIGVLKHGMENFDAMRNDPQLCFLKKKFVDFPTTLELNTRFKKLILTFQRKAESSTVTSKIVKWPKSEEADYMRVLRMYGVKDDNNSTNVINWEQFRELSTNLHKKTDAEMLEQLYCVLAMCTKQQGGELSVIDQKRASCVEPISQKSAEVLMNRIHLMRKIHAIITTGIQNVRSSLKICSVSAMPKGWSEINDENLLIVVDKFGLDNITSKLKLLPLFQKFNDLDEKMMLRRIVEICTTLENGKWTGNSTTTELIEDESNLSVQKLSNNLNTEESRPSSSSSPISTPNLLRNKSRKRVSISQQCHSTETQKASDSKPSGTANITSVTSLDLKNLEKEKKNLLQQQQEAFLKSMDQSSIQNYMLAMLGLTALDYPTNLKKSNSNILSNNNSLNDSAVAAATALQTLLGMSSIGGGADAASTASAALTNLFGNIPLNSLMNSIGMSSSNSKLSSLFSNMFKSNGSDVLNLTKKKSNNLNLSTSTSGKSSSSNKANTSKNNSSIQNVTNDYFKSINNNLASLSQLTVSELLTASRWPADIPVPIINAETGITLPTDKLPKLKNLDQWLLTHPKYAVDVASLMVILASSNLVIPTNLNTNRSKPVNNKESANFAALGNQKISGNNSAATSNTIKNLSKTTHHISPSTSNTVSTASTTTCSINETSSTKTTKLSNTTTAFSLDNSLQISVLHKNTGALMPIEKCPLLTNLSTWLDKNPDYNVHQNHALLVKGLLPKAYHNRIGSESTSSTANTTTISSCTTTTTTTNITTKTTTANSVSTSSASSLSSSSSTAAATQLIQSLAASMLPSITSSTSDSKNATAAICKLFSGTSNSLNTSSLSSNSAANFLNLQSNLSQNMEQLQMHFLLQQLMLPSSLMSTYPYASFMSSNGPSTSTAAASSSNTNDGNNSSTTASNDLAASLGLSNLNNSNNNLSNESLAAAAVLMGVGGSNNLDSATTTLLAQALSKPSTSTKSQQSNSLNNSSSSKNQSLLAYNNALNNSGQGNNATSNFLAETALAAELVANPTLLASMLNPSLSLGLSNNNNNAITAALAATLPFLSGSTLNSPNSLDAATMAMAAAATLGGIDPSIFAALSGSNSNLLSNNKLPPTSVSRKNTSTSTSASSNPSSSNRNSRSGLLNAVVEKLSNSSSAANAAETNKNSKNANNNNSNSSNVKKP